MISPDSRAVLIGVSRYDDAESFPDLQAAANSLRAMRTLLADPELCGWRPEQLIMVPDPRSRAEVEELLSDTAERTTGVLLIYYVGHGILSPRLELCLTVASTRPSRPKITGLPWESVTEILDVRNCPARARIAILDCCFAGQVISESLGSSTAVADTVAAEGIYTLTATIRNKTAHVVPADQQELACTSFTGELCDLVREGIVGRSEWLTLGDLYPVLRDRLHAKGLPLPNQRGTDTADRFPFTVNRALSAPTAARRPAASAVTAPASPSGAPEEDTELLRKTALDCFDAIVSYTYGTRDYSDDMTQYRLGRLAGYAAVADPDRAERIARRLPDQERRMRALAGVALVMATWAKANGHADAARASGLLERASRIADELLGLLASTRLGKILSESEPLPGRIGRFMQGLAESDPWVGQVRLVLALAARDAAETSSYFDQALQASSIFDRHGRSMTRSDVAKAMVTRDAERAFDVAKGIDDKDDRASTFRVMAQTMAAEDRDQAARMLAEAERTARKIRDKIIRAACLCQIAEALATLDPGWAERVANSVDYHGLGPAARYTAASLMARTDPVRAERIGRGLPHDADKAAILATVARFFADPDQTAALLTEAAEYLRPLEPDARRAAAMAEIARTLSAFDPGRATALFDEVEAMLTKIADTSQSHLILRVVRTTAEIDPYRAARILRNMCTMALSPDSQAVNDAGRWLTLQSIAEQCMKIISS